MSSTGRFQRLNIVEITNYFRNRSSPQYEYSCDHPDYRLVELQVGVMCLRVFSQKVNFLQAKVKSSYITIGVFRLSRLFDLVTATSICHFDGRSRLIGPGSDSDSRVLSDMVDQNPLWLPSTRASEQWLDYQTKYQASKDHTLFF